MEEIWKEYKTYSSNKYLDNTHIVTDIEVSNIGNIRGTLYNNQIFSEGIISIINGRKCIGKKPVYRLVWTVFNGPVPKGCCIHHKDHNKLNDRLDNLEMMTRSDHSKHHNDNMTEETKQKISESHKNIVFTEEHKENLRKSHLGIHMKEETKQKLSKIFSEYPRSEEWNKHISESRINHEVTEETRQKISAKSKGIKRGKFYNDGTTTKRFMADDVAISKGYIYKGKKLGQNKIMQNDE